MNHEELEWLQENTAGCQLLTEGMEDDDAEQLLEQATSLTATSPTFQTPSEAEMKAAMEYRNSHPSIATVVGLRLSEESQRPVKNFVEDHGLGSPADPEGMFIPLLLSANYQPIEIDSYLESLTFVVENYRLEFMVGDYGDGEETLLAVSFIESEENTEDPIWQLRKNLSLVYENKEYDWESGFYMPIAAPSDDFDYDEEDELASSKLGDLMEYCGAMKFDKVFVKHLRDKEMLDFIAGNTGALLDD